MAEKKTKTNQTAPDTTPAESAFPAGSRHQLARNANGHLAGETFTAEQAEASGIPAENFRPLDRAIKQPSR